jgi:hypothetical protein
MTQAAHDPIQAAIAAAKQVASAVPMGTAVAQAAPTAVASVLPAGRARTLDDAINSAGTSVDAWVSIEASGLRIGTKTFEGIRGKISLNEIAFPWMCRAAIGGATKFFRSYDGVREAQSGRPWADVVAQAQAMDANCRGQYDAAEIPLIIEDDLVLADKTLKAGARLGITTPVTGFKPFMVWLKDTVARFGSTSTVDVVAAVEQKTKPGVRPWGVPVFTTVS